MAGFEERAYKSIKSRHMVKVRELAEAIQANAGYVIADLDRARIPRSRSLPDDVRELDRRLNILEALEELKDIYDSASEG
jgi:3-methyladenine DNA glycosylase AlkC